MKIIRNTVLTVGFAFGLGLIVLGIYFVIESRRLDSTNIRIIGTVTAVFSKVGAEGDTDYDIHFSFDQNGKTYTGRFHSNYDAKINAPVKLIFPQGHPENATGEETIGNMSGGGSLAIVIGIFVIAWCAFDLWELIPAKPKTTPSEPSLPPLKK